MLAGTESDGLFRSDDGGQSWEPVSGFPEPCVTSLAFGPGYGRLIVAGTAPGWRSRRMAGQSWQPQAPELGPILSVAVTGDTILAGTVGAASSDARLPVT